MGFGTTRGMASLARDIPLLLVAASGLLRPQSNSFVGSKTCFACHSAIYQSFQKTDMGRSMSPASDWSTASLSPEATITQPGTAHTLRSFHDASGWHQSESEQGVFSVEYPVEYAVGSGANGITFLIRRGNFLFQAPLSYYSKTQKWDLSPGYEQADLGFSRAVPEECLNCHTGRAVPSSETPGAFKDPPFAEMAIGCENCHGPGADHVRSGGKQPRSIVNPAKLKPRLAENICMNCHQTGDTRVLQPGKHFSDFRPGEWLIDTVAIVKEPSISSSQEADLLEHFSAMQSSRCFRESGGKLSCLTCHDPHVQPRTSGTAAYFRARCLTCHTDASCTLPANTRAAQSPADDCAGCHMPKRKVLQVEHSALTNHRILAHEGEPVPTVPRKETDGLVIVNARADKAVQLSKVTLLQAYGELSVRHPQYREQYTSLLANLSHEDPQDPIVEEALGHQSFLGGQFEQAVAELRSALPLHKPAIHLELAQAEAKLGHDGEAIEYLKTGIALDPYDPVMRKTLILQYINSRAYAEARQRLEEYVSLFPEDSFMRSMLERVSK